MKYIAALFIPDESEFDEDGEYMGPLEHCESIDDGVIDVRKMAALVPGDSLGVETSVCHVWCGGVTIELIARIRAGIYDKSETKAVTS